MGRAGRGVDTRRLDKTCDGDMNDPRQLRKDLLELVDAKLEPSGFPVFNVRSIGYDPWHSRPFMSALAEETSIPCVEISQKPSTLTPVAVAFKTAVLSGHLWHLGNPVVKWMLGNVILEREGKYDAIVPVKRNKYEKIDAIQACLSAWVSMADAPAESVYNGRGIIFLDNDYTQSQPPKGAHPSDRQ
jgi:phage terminase large subunit-like protein